MAVNNAGFKLLILTLPTFYEDGNTFKTLNKLCYGDKHCSLGCKALVGGTVYGIQDGIITIKTDITMFSCKTNIYVFTRQI